MDAAMKYYYFQQCLCCASHANLRSLVVIKLRHRQRVFIECGLRWITFANQKIDYKVINRTAVNHFVAKFILSKSCGHYHNNLLF